MEQRLAAYGLFLLVGLTVPAIAVLIIDGIRGLAQTYGHPERPMLLMLILPGLAAVLAAAAVTLPFMRAVENRNRLQLHAWALAGVLAAHLIYTIMILAELYFGFHTMVGEIFGLHASKAWSVPRRELLNVAGSAGVISLMLGFIPNQIVASGFAEFLLWRERQAASSTITPQGEPRAEQLP